MLQHTSSNRALCQAVIVLAERDLHDAYEAEPLLWRSLGANRVSRSDIKLKLVEVLDNETNHKVKIINETTTRNSR
jgi:hypothetical protein